MHPVRGRLDLVEFGDVGRNRECANARRLELLRGRVEAFAVPGQDGHVRAALGAAACDGSPDAR